MAGDAKTLFQQGVQAIRDDDNPSQGRRYLVESLRADPNNDVAWVWLSHAVDDPAKKLDCLNHALAINPANRQALNAMQRLDAGSRPFIEETPAPAKKTRTQEMKARSTDMGALLESSGINKGELFQKVVLAIASIGLAIVLFITARATTASPNGISTLLMIGAIIPLIGLPVFIYLILRSYGLQIAVYENGIRRTQGKQSQSWRWEDFSAMRVADKTLVMRKHGVPVYETNTYTCRLLIADKTALKIDKDLQKCREIGKLITQKTTPIFFERNYKAHRNGDTVYYGKVAVNRDGIRDGRRSIAWDEIVAWNVDNGTLIIQKPGRGKFRLHVLDMPNAYVLMAMIEKITAKSY